MSWWLHQAVLLVGGTVGVSVRRVGWRSLKWRLAAGAGQEKGSGCAAANREHAGDAVMSGF